MVKWYTNETGLYTLAMIVSVYLSSEIPYLASFNDATTYLNEASLVKA